MKKTYEAPKAEKTEFNYSDVVVASGTTVCQYGYDHTQTGYGCDSYQVPGSGHWIDDQA